MFQCFYVVLLNFLHTIDHHLCLVKVAFIFYPEKLVLFVHII